MPSFSDRLRRISSLGHLAILLGLGASLAGYSGGAGAGRTASDLPSAQWDFRSDGAEFTQAALAALASHGAALPAGTPADVRHWCPGYLGADTEDRAAFWTGFLSALAKYESTWNPQAVGGGGQWFGLTQISPATARGYGCAATSGQALLDGPANLSCAIRIMAVTVPRDGVIAEGGGGVAADWAPLLSASKRESMRDWTAAQPYCR